MPHETGTLPPRQRRAAALLGLGLPAAQVALDVKAGEDTIRAWQRDPAFAALRDACLDAHMRAVIPEAINVFVEQIRDSRDKSASLRQSAAHRFLAIAQSAASQSAAVEVRFDGAPAPGEPEQA